MIFIVGDKPSKKNVNPDVAFVGTTSYRRLLLWIYELDISITDVVLCNKDQVSKTGDVSTPGLHACIEDGDRVLALGKEASKRLNKLGIAHFTMPHPSGANRQLNDKGFVREMLEGCKTYLDL